jgi:ATP-dependent Zn protease
MFCDYARAVSNTRHDTEQARILAAFVTRSPASVDAYLAFCCAEARGILTEHTDTAIALVEALVERRTLTRAEIDAVIGRATS